MTSSTVWWRGPSLVWVVALWRERRQSTPYFCSSSYGLGRDGERKRCCHQIRGRVEEWQSVIFQRHTRSVDWNCTDVPTLRSRERTYNFTLSALGDECLQYLFPMFIRLPCMDTFTYMGSVCVDKLRFVENVSRKSTRQCRPSIHLV